MPPGLRWVLPGGEWKSTVPGLISSACHVVQSHTGESPGKDNRAGRIARLSLATCRLRTSRESQGEASLVAQWLRICLPMQGTRVRSLAREDPTCRGAAKPLRHNY